MLVAPGLFDDIQANLRNRFLHLQIPWQVHAGLVVASQDAKAARNGQHHL
jgi:hypothetical protein